MTRLEEKGDGSAFIKGSRELRGELSDEGTSSRADKGAGGCTVITILQTNSICYDLYRVKFVTDKWLEERLGTNRSRERLYFAVKLATASGVIFSLLF